MLFAFHEPWEPEEDENPEPFPWSWLGIVLGGLLIGVLIYWVLVPLGAASRLAAPAPTDPVEQLAEQVNETPSPVASQAQTMSCTSPTTPNAVVSEFFNALGRSDYEAAWELVGPEHRQEGYNRALSQFTLNWAAWQNPSLGQTTISLIDEQQATAVVQIKYSQAQSKQIDVRMAFRFDRDLCRWIITQISPLQPPAN